jgi:putative endopeptidase
MIQSGSANPGIPPINRKFSPGEDFYSYINNNWIKDAKLPPYEGSFSVSEEIEDDVRDKLLTIIVKQQKEQPDTAISKIATSFLNYSYQKNSIVSLNQYLGKLNCLKTMDEFGYVIGEMNRIQAKSPFSLVVSGDSYNTSKCRIYLYEASLGLSSKHYYYVQDKKGAETNHVLSKYSAMLKQVSELLLQPSLESLVAIEQTIVPLMSRYDERSDMDFSYNPYSFADLQKKYKHIPWAALIDGLGLSESLAKKTTFIVTNDRYFKYMNELFRLKDIEGWRKWLRGLMVLSFLEYLPPPFDDHHFDFFGKLLKGNKEKLPQKLLMLKVLQKFCPQDLGEIFVKNAVPEGTKRVAIQIVKSLKTATIKRLERIPWIGEKAKNEAIKKVKNMKFQVAYPEKWQSETKGCVINKEQPLDNIFKLNMKDTALMLNDLKTGCSRDENEWEDGAFEVNAYYYSEGNMMVIPAGILRPPFFDLKKSMAWNLGAIGSAIGHEITHGFDTDGRMYDAIGNWNNWWSKSDEENFTNLTKKVVALFHGVEYMDGKIDGEMTLSENLADIGGMAIALEALNDILKDKSEKEKKMEYIEFFKSYAVSWRNKDRPQKAKESLFSDSHAPAKFRVNKIVHQFEEFYIAFDIKKGDVGWVEPADRIILW